MVTVIKLSPSGREKLRYSGELVKRTHDSVVIQAYWTQAARDLGYTRFEPGDRFIEYYYTDLWFNIFDISTHGVRKGWYCNITEPAHIFADHIEQVDLFLDVWIDPAGQPLILDEDEFIADTTLNERQRQGAQEGLQLLLHQLENRRLAFADLTVQTK